VRASGRFDRSLSWGSVIPGRRGATRGLAPLGLALATASCSFDIANSNSPSIIGENPTRSEVAATATGILIATRGDVGLWALVGGILGREAYRFDGSDPRWTGELMQGPLDPGGFGSFDWGGEYAAIRTADDLLAVITTASALTLSEQSATSGFAHTLQAYNFLIVLDSHLQDSIPLDVTTDVTAPPAPFAPHEAGFDRVVSLLDGAAAELDAGGEAFPFSLPSGFSGFNTPAAFRRFNRALRARVAVYRGDFTGALALLAESFLDPAGPLDAGVYMDFSPGPGDSPNPLALDPVSGENVPHPSLEAEAQLQPGGAVDARLTAKTVKLPDMRAFNDLATDLGWIRYPSPNSPIPLIKNEELVLLRAEANLGLGNLDAARSDIDLVRTVSGHLGPYSGGTDSASLLTELLYNKRYSLLYEGAHSWIDYRRYDRLADLATIERPGDVLFTTLPIPNDEVLPRR